MMWHQGGVVILSYSELERYQATDTLSCQPFWDILTYIIMIQWWSQLNSERQFSKRILSTRPEKKSKLVKCPLDSGLVSLIPFQHASSTFTDTLAAWRLPTLFLAPNLQLNTVLVGVQGVDNDVHNSAHFSLKLKLLAICGLCGRGSCSAFSTSAQAELPVRHWQPNCVWTKGRNLQVRMILLMQLCADRHLSLWSAC